MPSVRDTRPIRGKPPLGSSINWAHPFTGNGSLVAFWPFQEGAGNNVTDLVSGNVGISTSLPWAQTASGLALACNNTPSSNNIALGTASWLNVTGPITMLCATNQGPGNNAQIFGCKKGSSAFDGYSFGFGVLTLGKLSYFSSITGTWQESLASQVDGKLRVYGVTVAGSGAGQTIFYRDGVPAGTATSNFPGSYVGTRVLFNGATAGVTPVIGSVLWAAVYSSALDPVTMAAIGADPAAIFQLLQPARGSLLFEGPAAAPPAFQPWIYGDQIQENCG